MKSGHVGLSEHQACGAKSTNKLKLQLKLKLVKVKSIPTKDLCFSWNAVSDKELARYAKKGPANHLSRTSLQILLVGSPQPEEDCWQELRKGCLHIAYEGCLQRSMPAFDQAI